VGSVPLASSYRAHGASSRGAIILGLVVERHRRHAAERVSRSRTLEAIHLNRTATVSALSGSVAHELSQPLSAILNYAAAAATYLSQDPLNLTRLKDIVDRIQHSGTFAAQIISHLRSLLRKTEEMELREVDLGDVIDAALDILQSEAAKKGVAISVQKSGPSTIRGDHVHLQQVVLNLVGNAMDAMSSSAWREKAGNLHLHQERNRD
jgi:C4-dicarboxylate-specific signal transduction histidine kinase